MPMENSNSNKHSDHVYCCGLKTISRTDKTCSDENENKKKILNMKQIVLSHLDLIQVGILGFT